MPLLQPSQQQINDICHALQKQGEEVCIDKVKTLLGSEYSYIDIARKVILFKEDYKKALNLGRASSQSLSIEQPTLVDNVQKALATFGIESKECVLKVKHMIDDECAEQTAKLKSELYRLETRVLNLEGLYLAEKSKYSQLLEKYQNLKDQHYALSQEVQKLSSARAGIAQPIQQKISDFRDVDVQLSTLNASKMAVYDLAKKVVVIKAPSDDVLIKTLNSGNGRAYIHAVAEYDYKRKCWQLSGFNIQTIEFLMRNQFVISAELSYIHQALRQKQQKN